MTTNTALYNKCIESCDLESAYTDKLYGEVFDRASPKKNAELQIKVDTSAKHKNDTTIEASLDAKLNGYLSAKAKNAAWTIEAKVIAIFTIEEECTLSDEELELFASRQGVLTLMPYLRSAVSSLSTDIGLGPITLPLMKLFPTLSEHTPASDV